MATERVVNLRGVKADAKSFNKLPELQYPIEIDKIGERVAKRLNKLLPVVEGKGVFEGLILWDFEGSDDFCGEDQNGNELLGFYLRCGDFYASKIMFFNDVSYDPDCFVLSICGSTNFRSELWNGFGSELQIVFKRQDDRLKFDEVLFLGQQDHHFDVYSFEINDGTRLKIMAIADRATNIFTRMDLLSNKV